MSRKITRASNIELLRICATLMVVMLHCLNWTGAIYYEDNTNMLIYYGVNALCYCAVNLFVLINGYFMVNGKFKANSLFKLVFCGVWLYSVIFGLINAALSGSISDTKALLMCFLPITTKKYWFINAYLLLYILSPFINKLIACLTKKQFTLLYACSKLHIRSLLFPFHFEPAALGFKMSWTEQITIMRI